MNRNARRVAAKAAAPVPKPSIFIATPVYRDCSPLYTRMMMQLSPMLRERGIRYELSFVRHTCVAFSRNKLAADFLASGLDLMWCIDSDMSIAPETVLRLYATGKDFVSCAGLHRSPPGDFGVETHPPLSCSIKIDTTAPIVDGLIEVPHALTACTMIHRSVFETVKPTTVHFEYNGQTIWDFFGPLVSGGTYFGAEDYAFCERYRVLGGKQHVLVDADVEHDGLTMNLRRLLDARKATT